ncbi:MAG: hypothetical protein ACRD1T_18995, partial [Acidimicrobiia bacterium]
ITAGLGLVTAIIPVLQTLIVGDRCLPGDCSSQELQRQIRLQMMSSLLVLPVSLFQNGWYGTERVWYLRIFRERSLSRGEGWSFTWSFFGRFFVLTLLGALIFIPVYTFIFWSAVSRMRGQPGPIDFADLRLWRLGIAAVVALVAEFLLTFVTPALAYSTRRVREALGIGIRMIKQTWPRCVPYVVVPPLAVTLVTRFFLPESVGIGWRVALLPGSALLNLLFKGATAAFYLRRFEVGDNGAVGKEPMAQEQPSP